MNVGNHLPFLHASEQKPFVPDKFQFSHECPRLLICYVFFSDSLSNISNFLDWIKNTFLFLQKKQKKLLKFNVPRKIVILFYSLSMDFIQSQGKTRESDIAFQSTEKLREPSWRATTKITTKTRQNRSEYR